MLAGYWLRARARAAFRISFNWSFSSNAKPSAGSVTNDSVSSRRLLINLSFYWWFGLVFTSHSVKLLFSVIMVMGSIRCGCAAYEFTIKASPRKITNNFSFFFAYFFSAAVKLCYFFFASSSSLLFVHTISESGKKSDTEKNCELR